MPRVILSGAPGVGKTTLLAELAARGFATVAESAREVIAERLARGDTPRPAPAAFARELYRRDRLKHDGARPGAAPVFFDRCAVESLAMLHEAAPLADADLAAELAALQFHRTVFLLPPWPAIYRNDAEREHPFEHAERVHGQLLRWYRRCGYSILELPRLTVAQRADLLLQALAAR